MAETVNAEEQKRRVQEIQIEMARSMKVQSGILEILKQVKRWQEREWLYVCALDGMPETQLRKLIAASTVQIQKARQDFWRDKCIQSDTFPKRLESLQKEVTEVCSESRQVRRSIEEGLEEALKKQAAAQEETIKTKDKMIEMLQGQITELQGKIKEAQSIPKKNMQQQEQKPENPPDMILPEQTDLKPDLIAGKKKDASGIGKLISKFRKDADIKRFIERYIANADFSPEQVMFLLNCMEEGMSISDIEKFASPNLSVEVMQRIKALQNRKESRT